MFWHTLNPEVRRIDHSDHQHTSSFVSRNEYELFSNWYSFHGDNDAEEPDKDFGPDKFDSDKRKTVYDRLQISENQTPASEVPASAEALRLEEEKKSDFSLRCNCHWEFCHGRKSNLTFKEKNEYLALLDWSNQHSNKEAKRFAVLQAKIEREQQQFLGDMQRWAMSRKDLYEFVPDGIEQKVTQLIEAYQTMVERSFPRFYKQIHSIQIRDHKLSDISLGTPVHVKETGSPLEYCSAAPKTKIVPDDIKEFTANNLLPTLSMDPFIAQILHEIEDSPNLISSPQALIEILSTLPPREFREWKIPVKITETAQGKVFYLEDPLLPWCLTPKLRSLEAYQSLLPHVTSRGESNQRCFSYSIIPLGSRKMLIRSTVFCKDSSERSVCPIVKLEYFPQHGFEEVTPYEQIQTWVNVKTGPSDSVAFLYRIHVAEQSILSVEESRKDLTPPTMNYGLLMDILRLLGTCNPGHYLLCHTSQQSRVVLYQNTDQSIKGYSTDSLDLHDRQAFICKESCEAFDFVKWVWPASNVMNIPYIYHVCEWNKFGARHQKPKKKKKRKQYKS